MKNTRSKIKPIKIGKQSEITYYLGCKDYTQNVRSQEVKMTNKILRKKLTVLFVGQINQDLKKKKLTIDVIKTR